MTWNFVIKDSNALQICKGREVVCEGRSAVGTKRLAKLLNLGLQVERQRAEAKKSLNDLIKVTTKKSARIYGTEDADGM